MLVNGKYYRSIWLKEAGVVQTFDQRKLPHEIQIIDLKTAKDSVNAIKDMVVRGAPLIGVTACYGIYLAAYFAMKWGIANSDSYIKEASADLRKARPTAVNLMWAVDTMTAELDKADNLENKVDIALKTAKRIEDEDAEMCRNIGLNGLKIIEDISRKKKGGTVNILTHCNAGWIAVVDYGTATAPIYAAHQKGIKVHVWVDETRPWNQGARLTSWELTQNGVPNTLIADNTGGLLMQRREVDAVITGADRVTMNGDAANKIGTYLKALAAEDNEVPFYIALPKSTFDWKKFDGIKEIEIEERGGDEMHYVSGKTKAGTIETVRITHPDTIAKNYGFDVTPAKLITGLITERGIIHPPFLDNISKMYPEYDKTIYKTIIEHHRKQIL
jgi:methylthioribose-1-phosphate isomerase